MPLTSYTAEIQSSDISKLREILSERGFDFSEKPYAHYSAKKGKLNVTVYEKGPKVLVQGKETEDFVTFILEPEILGEAKLGYEEEQNPQMFTPHFGIDESGKGDYFGPLVTAGVYVNSSVARAFLDQGIMDSKRISSATKIRKLAKMIRETPGAEWSIVMITPKRYNELYEKFNNLNRLLAWAHAKVIVNLKEKVPSCPRALSDQFAREQVLQSALARESIEIELEQRTKGESDLAVAAASILAREKFIDWIDEASERGGIVLPLGAGAKVIEAVRESVSKHGIDTLGALVKKHFKTTNEL